MNNKTLLEANKTRFKELLGRVERRGMPELLDFLERSDFYTAPASTRFHGNFEGGLLQHSLYVYEELQRLLKAYPEVTVPEESAILCPLLHDICKANYYTTEKRNRKNAAGAWETYDYYAVKEKFCFGGHGSKSVFMLQNYITLTPEEAVAINCHMGAWQDGDTRPIGDAFERYPFAFLLHTADSAATFLREKTIEI